VRTAPVKKSIMERAMTSSEWGGAMPTISQSRTMARGVFLLLLILGGGEGGCRGGVDDEVLSNFETVEGVAAAEEGRVEGCLV
jgi:hypothetical protein